MLVACSVWPLRWTKIVITIGSAAQVRGSALSPESEPERQSPTLTDSAACAAARRATGTRYGDALT